MKILTLCANQGALDDSLVPHLHQFGLKVSNVIAVNAEVMHVVCGQGGLTEALRQFFYKRKIDFAMQKVTNRPKKIFLSDMDATMVVGETIDEMADKLGVGDKVKVITAAAMAGELDFPKALKARLELIEGLNKYKIFSIADEVELAKGSKQLIQAVQRASIYSCLISGGFSIFTKVVSEKLGFDTHVSNRLVFDENDGLLPIWYGDAVTAKVKEETLLTLATQQSVGLSDCVAIGDGANDAKMIERAGLGIAYYGKPLLRKVANAEIHSGDLSNVIHFISLPEVQL